MGTYISLDVGTIEITWSNNHPGPDHSCLFHETDRVDIRHDWSGDDACQKGFRSTVAAVLPRIELLGHTLDRARREYETAVTINTRERRDYAEAVGEPAPSTGYLTFDEILTIVRSLRAKDLSKEIDEEDQEPKRILASKLMQSLPWYGVEEYGGRSFDLDTIFSESTSAEYVLGGFDPYTIIRLLAENPDNLDCPVTWDYGPLVSSGWAREEEFAINRRDRDCFLIVTEGGSDAVILRRAIELLRPQIRDFFRYIDMEEGYPFSGTGQLHMFIQGLVAMRVPLNVVAVYDNDAEGFAAFQKTNSLKLIPSYRVCILPELAELSSFPTTGPTGTSLADINRQSRLLTLSS
ncbi:HEPN/Toprim-associated domain-containing protein [Sinorhizobium saheli]|uniref:HEPN/Toprim N-terminal domain-containing protein n=1 Tax=Sinorhizobium saheli TaxID=36856 RepID=A0A178Y8Y1_SINSA|nr:HEPN/Toprim-associated domain-containing protein [Sinorhizobium saheli]MQW88685.1 hypothetical protein [Sinorhizobium saheli]OAP43543.1 hypothetical protein ATB98_24465 [Sinorhizobium saheli]